MGDLDKTSSTMAHELVHAMGVAHDGAEGNQDCAGDGLIMDPIYNGATEWSACSKRSLARFVNSYAGDCLRDDSPIIPKPKQSLRFKLLVLLLVFFAMGIITGIPYWIIDINEDWVRKEKKEKKKSYPIPKAMKWVIINSVAFRDSKTI